METKEEYARNKVVARLIKAVKEQMVKNEEATTKTHAPNSYTWKDALPHVRTYLTMNNLR